MRSSTQKCDWLGPFLPALSLSFALFLSSCAAHRPPLGEIRGMETRVLAGDERSVFAACVGTLQDMGYALESSDSEGGVLTASRVTNDPSDAMPELQTGSSQKKGMPTWGKVALVATGVILVVGVAALVTHGDDHHDAEAHVAPSDSTRPRDGAEGRRMAERRIRHNRHEGSSVVAGFSAPAPEPPMLHEYRITVHLLESGDEGTQVRVSLQRTDFQGSETIRSGPLDDPALYSRFFEALDQSLGYELQAAR